MIKIIFILVICTLFLESCNTVRDSAGVNRKVIDEYTVIENPPLVIPPDFNVLPPEQMDSKNIQDTDSELAKEILFGLDDNQYQKNNENSLINKIIKETEANNVDTNIRNTINEQFAGEKSSIQDETEFTNEDQLNEAIEETSKKTNNQDKNKKNKKKKRFFFF